MPRDKVKINVKDKLEDNVLDLSLLEITEVPVRDIAALRRATILDLSNNKIGFLGKNFATLTQITKLDLSKNEIKFLPDNFGELLNLRHLDLYNNKLEHLPLSFGNLSKLRYLDLKANPLNPALLKIVGPCLSSKDCADAAKRVVPFMFNIEKEVKAEQNRKQEEEERQKQEEEKKKIEEEKAAKKRQAKKDKNYRDKIRKREAENREKLIENQVDDLVNKNGNAIHEQPYRDQSLESPGILFILVKFLVLLAVFLAITFIISMRFFPQQFDKIMEFLPIQHQVLIRSFYKKCAILIHHYFDKALNLYKFN